MSRTALKTAELHASLAELMRAGSPVDLSVATKPEEREKVEIEQVGGIHDSEVFELPDGRVAVMADIAVTNQTTRAIDVIDIELQTPWGDSLWDWLTPQRVRFRGAKREGSYQAYQFPGKCGLQLPYEEVINHVLLERRRLPGKRRLEGWLLGIGGRMPAELRRGQWLDLSFAIIGSDHTEYATTIQLWTERLEARPKTVTPRTSLFEQEALPPREVTRTAVRTASQSGPGSGSAPGSEAILGAKDSQPSQGHGD
jgi:hypothetical protein